MSRLGVIGTFLFYHNKSLFPRKPKTDKGACKAIKRKKNTLFCIFASQNSIGKLLYLLLQVFHKRNSIDINNRLRKTLKGLNI